MSSPGSSYSYTHVHMYRLNIIRERGERGGGRMSQKYWLGWKTKACWATAAAKRAINRKKSLVLGSSMRITAMLLSVQVAWSTKTAAKSLALILIELTFTLCLKTRQSICCVLAVGVSSVEVAASIWLIIYITFTESGSDLLSSFRPLCLFIPRPRSDCHRRIYHGNSTNYISDEKNLYFIYYFISLLLGWEH